MLNSRDKIRSSICITTMKKVFLPRLKQGFYLGLMGKVTNSVMESFPLLPSVDLSTEVKSTTSLRMVFPLKWNQQQQNHSPWWIARAKKYFDQCWFLNVISSLTIVKVIFYNTCLLKMFNVVRKIYGCRSCCCCPV